MKRVRIVSMIMLLFVFVWVPWTESSAEASNQRIYEEMSKNFLACKKEFSIKCSYNEAEDIIKRLNSNNETKYYSVFFDIAQAVDDKNTTDDGDYLYGNICNVYCYYADGELHFYDVTYFETVKQRKKVNRKITKVAKQIMKKKKSRKGRIALAYEYVIDTVTYDNRKNCKYSAYGGLFGKNKTVCNGYAQILYKLLMEMDIPCKFVSGYLKDGKKCYLHAWNMVKVGGKWYNLDACSDDEDDGFVYKDFFLKTDKQLKKTHKKDTFYKTKAFTKKYVMAKTKIAS